MGSEDIRFIRSLRRHNKYRNIEKQVKICLTYGVPVVNKNRYGKVKALNCGQSHCMMCGNPRKFWGEKTIQEKRFYQDNFYQDNEDDTND